MRQAIEEVGGDEVFFVGRVGPNDMVEEIEVAATGTKDAVLAVESMVRAGSVVVHNHPGGDLRPSDADLKVASQFGERGIGSYIVDNAVEKMRMIVRHLPAREKQRLDGDRLEKMLKPDGDLAGVMSGYEYRPEQIDMMRLVADAFNDDGIAVIEAGTGTGKSLAYLLPAIHWAKNNSEKVIISTKTINLQEQLIGKDIPFLNRKLGLEFKAELMIGRNNYLCRRKAKFAGGTPDFFGDEKYVAQVDAILEWARSTERGVMSELSFVPTQDAWEEVACDGDNCQRIRCEFYADCFFYRARRAASQADILVANHHLVMADLAVRMESKNYTSALVLPPYKRIIFDEAHSVESVATEYFGLRLTRRSLARILTRLVRRERASQGLLPWMRAQLVSINQKLGLPALTKAARLIEDELIPLRTEAAADLDRLMDTVARGAQQVAGTSVAPGREVKLRIVPRVEETSFWDPELRLAIDGAVSPLRRLSAGLKEVIQSLGDLPDETFDELANAAGELRSIANRLSSRADALREFYSAGEGRCRWIEVAASRRPRQKPHVRLVSLPLDVRDQLGRAVYNRMPTVVMTSATLTVQNQFNFFMKEVGLCEESTDSDTVERIEQLQLDTPFDYERQAFVGVPLDLPDPKHPEFTREACDFLMQALQHSRGSAFVLFTSYNQLRQFHRALAPILEPLGYACLLQGTENRDLLLRRFKNDHNSILFATSSFWEGVDVPGDALRLLVLAKLPFAVPTDPLVQARIEMLQEQGVDPFTNYSVPQAVIRFKQGFGRLIRTKDDRGAVLILDNRIAKRHYGRIFFDSLPAETFHCLDSEPLLEDLSRFLR